MSKRENRVLVIDFGSQYSHLICRRLRDSGVYSELQSCLLSLAELQAFDPKAVILSGGPSSVYEENAPRLDGAVFEYMLETKIAILGICYGLQELVRLAGGKIEPAEKREYGNAAFTTKPNRLFQSCETTFNVWMSHGDSVTGIPDNFEVIGTTDNCGFAAIMGEMRDVPIFGLQFHPEVNHTEHGTTILSNFTSIAGVVSDWSVDSFLEAETKLLKEKYGDKYVIAGVSGGVDSSVASVLVARALGPDRVFPVFVDNGLLREAEAESVTKRLGEFLPKLKVVQAQNRFYSALAGVTEPETKRKIIGSLFIDVFVEEVNLIRKSHPEIQASDFVLLQGTLYPDVIESTSFKGPSSVIKSHHNVGGLPESLNLQLLEPLRLLFKDEVRGLGKLLSLPSESLWLHPFPGPALGIRVIGEVNEANCTILRKCDHIFLEELRSAGIYSDIGQAFAVLMPNVKTVGVMGDKRTYESLVSLRAVETTDFMTAKCFRVPYPILEKCSSRIINEVSGVNRVVFDISSKPPATIEWE